MFSDRLKEIRQKSGMTQLQLADKLSVERSSITKYETGANMPSDTILIKIADLFNVSLDFLFDHNLPVTKPNIVLLSDEESLIESYRLLNEQGQEYIRQTMAMAVQIYKKNTQLPDVEAEIG